MAEFEEASTQIRNALYGMAEEAQGAISDQDIALAAMGTLGSQMGNLAANLDTLLTEAREALQYQRLVAQQACADAQQEVQTSMNGLAEAKTSRAGNRVAAQATAYSAEIGELSTELWQLLAFDDIEAAATGLRAALIAKQTEAKKHLEIAKPVQEKASALAADATSSADAMRQRSQEE